MVSISTLLNLLAYAVALLGFVPLAPYLERLPALSVPLALLFGLFADRRRRALSGWLPTLLSFALFGYYLLQVNRQNLVGPVVNVVAVLLAVRLASEKSPRHYLQIFMLALFSLAASSLFNLDPRFLAYLALLLALVAVALVFLCFYSSNPSSTIDRRSLRSLLMVALILPLATLPLMVVFFFLLPRTQFPLWQFLTRAGSDRASLSDSVQPGDKSTVSTSGSVVFRAATNSLPADQLYWRVTVLNAFDNQTWHRVPPPASEKPLLWSGTTARQTIYLEPGRPAFYPGLNLPRQLIGVRSSATVDQLFPVERTTAGRLRYEVLSVIDRPLKTGQGINRAFYTRLPDRISPRLQSLGRAIAVAGETDGARLQLLEKFFADQRLSYATSGLPTGPKAMEDFLYNTRRGHCELFAATFAVLLRGAGVPARLVGGYYGGEYNEVGSYYAVTEDRAHVWVEAWLDGRGWVSVDPSRLTVNFSDVNNPVQSTFRKRLTHYLDALGYFWSVTVITYDLEKQLSTATAAGSRLKNLTLPPLPRVWWFWLALAGLGISGVARFIFLRRLTPEQRLLQKFRATLLNVYGLDLRPTAGLKETVAHLPDPAVQRFVAIYTAALYHDRPINRLELDELGALLQSIRRRNKDLHRPPPL